MGSKRFCVFVGCDDGESGSMALEYLGLSGGEGDTVSFGGGLLILCKLFDGFFWQVM